MDLQATLLILAAVVIAILTGVAVYYLKKAKAAEAKQKQEQQEWQEKVKAQRIRVNKSIQIIAQSMFGDELTMTEGAIRIRVLLDGLQVEEPIKEEFSAFYQFSDAVDHIPILEEWKKLSTKKKMGFDNERAKLEKTHNEFVMDAAKRILGRDF